MIQAFIEDQDIHAATAAAIEILSTKSPRMRRQAKQ
jgi:DNA polymerase I-like protein with 3'-5' exonuclease and polymerase domains